MGCYLTSVIGVGDYYQKNISILISQYNVLVNAVKQIRLSNGTWNSCELICYGNS